MNWLKYRKIWLIASVSVFVVLWIHLVGAYFYEWGVYNGVPGGSISIGMIGQAPDPLNPLTYGMSGSTDMMMTLMFRGLIHYNIKDEIYEWDLAHCDLSTLTKVTCTLNKDAIWSDGTPITTDDVVATMAALRKWALSDKIRSLLGRTTTTVSQDGSIVFETAEKNPLMIEVLSYPILRSDFLEQLRTGRAGTGSYVSSGPYVFAEKTKDTEYGFDRITLVKNTKYLGTVWLDKIHLKFFADIAGLERSSEALNIIIPPVKNESLKLSARFQPFLYANYEFFGAFFNTDTLTRDLRNVIHWNLGNAFSGVADQDERPVRNIFLRNDPILPTETLDSLAEILKEKWYARKQDMLAKATAISTTVSGEAVIPNGKYFANQWGASIIFLSDGSGGYLISWDVPATTTSVAINGYNLQEFVPGNTTFAYRATSESGTLREGQNLYQLTLTKKDGTTSTGTLTVYYSPDANALAGYKKQVQDAYNATQNTPAIIADRERQKQEVITKIEWLEGIYYFNEKYEPFSLNVAYTTGFQSTEFYANAAAITLKDLGIKANLLPKSTKDIQDIIKTGKKDYDVLFIGVEAPKNISRIGQVFLSTEAGTGVNFSNIQSKNLDNSFALLRATTDPEQVRGIQDTIIKIMEKESFFLPLAQPLHKAYIDRNIKGIDPIATIPDISGFATIISKASIKDIYVVDTTTRSFGGFFSWLFTKF